MVKAKGSSRNHEQDESAISFLHGQVNPRLFLGNKRLKRSETVLVKRNEKELDSKGI